MKIDIVGAKEIIKALDQLAPKVERKVLRQSIRKGLKPLLDECKANAPVAPVDGGKLRDSLAILTALGKKKRGTIALEVRPREKWWAGEHYYPAQVEYGRPNLDNHMEPNPFMAEAFSHRGEAAKDVALQEIKKGIDKIVENG
jgi:HK97 gp10 family phage protein